jgi:hypothetical protein
MPQTHALGMVGTKILSGWQANGILRLTSGHPVNITSGTDTNVDGQNNDRPDVIGQPKYSVQKLGDRVAYIDKSAFAVPQLGSVGNAGRGLVYGPHGTNYDMSFFKAIPIHERQRLQFRAEFFNIFNHPSFNPPVAVFTNPNFGQILNAIPGRIIQFGLRFTF